MEVWVLRFKMDQLRTKMHKGKPSFLTNPPKQTGTQLQNNPGSYIIEEMENSPYMDVNLLEVNSLFSAPKGPYL